MRLDMKTQTSGQTTKAAIHAHHLRTARAEARKNKVLQSSGALRCRRKFLRYFPNGFMDDNYLAWERDYKVAAHRSWNAMLNHQEFAGLLRANKFEEIALRAVRIESRTNLIFSFEKMALRDAVRTKAGAAAFAHGLYDFVYGQGRDEDKFEGWCNVVASLPRVKTRVLTWPIVTAFGFIALPRVHFFYKPTVTRVAAHMYGYPLHYVSRPSWQSYRHVLDFAALVRQDLSDLKPRDMIDIQSFLWVQGSAEYPD
jgi:hypothetical protein